MTFANSESQTDMFKLVVLSNKQPQTKLYWYNNNIKQKKRYNSYIWEPKTNKSLSFFFFAKQSLRTLQLLSPNTATDYQCRPVICWHEWTIQSIFFHFLTTVPLQTTQSPSRQFVLNRNRLCKEQKKRKKKAVLIFEVSQMIQTRGQKWDPAQLIPAAPENEEQPSPNSLYRSTSWRRRAHSEPTLS